MAKHKAKVQIEAVLELEPECLKYLDQVPLEELEGMIYEIKEAKIPFSFERLRGVVRFVVPNALELKRARLAQLE